MFMKENKMNDKFFIKLKEKIDLLQKEKNKDRMKGLIIDIIVSLEKFCHEDDVQIHGVLAEARARCKSEINKTL